MLLFPGVVILFVIALLLLEVFAEQLDLRRYPPRGNFVAGLHAVETGTGTPTVILESGLAASSLSWVSVQPQIAQFARVISYDRAGLGWSAALRQSLTLTRILSDLETVSKTKEPLILVGHSFGGLIVTAFAALHPDRVSGVVLVDPVSLTTYSQPDAQHAARLKQAARLSRRGAWLAHLGIVRGALFLVASGSRKLPAFIGRVSAGKGSSVMNRLATEVAKLPPETHGVIRAHWSRPGSFRSMAEYLEFLPSAASEVQRNLLPSVIPVIVLSAETANAQELAERDSWIHDRPSSRHTQVPNTTHWVQLDRPDLIVEAVRELCGRKAAKCESS